MGLTALLPLLVILIGNIGGGIDGISAGFRAYALSQKTPSFLLIPLMGVMIAGGIWATIAFIPQSKQAEQGSGQQPPASPELKAE